MNPGKILKALDNFQQRSENQPKHQDNSRLNAGSPMWFYCHFCGHVSDLLPEDYICLPRQICTQCQELINQGQMPAIWEKLTQMWQQPKSPTGNP